MAEVKDIMLMMALVAVVHIHGEIRIVRSHNSLTEPSTNKELDHLECDAVAGFPELPSELRKNVCDKPMTSQQDDSEQLPSEDLPELPKSPLLTPWDALFLSFLCILFTLLIAVVVYKVNAAYGNSCRSCLRKLFRRHPDVPPVQIELQEFTEYFVPRLNIFCNLSKKPGRYTKIPNFFTKKHMTYDIEDQQYYFDIRVNIHRGKFRNTKKKEYLPMEGFTFKEIMNIIQEFVYGTEQSQNDLLQALDNPDTEASQMIIVEATTNPTAIPLPSLGDSDEELLLPQRGFEERSSISKKKKSGRQTLTVLKESLARGMSGSSSGTFATHEPPEKSDSLGYGTASTFVSTPKEGPSTEGSLEDFTDGNKVPVNLLAVQPETSNGHEPLATRKNTSSDEEKGLDRQNKNLDEAIPSLRELARKSLSSDGEQRQANEASLNTSISSLEVEASSTCSKAALEQSFDEGAGNVSVDSIISAASEKFSVVEDPSKPQL